MLTAIRGHYDAVIAGGGIIGASLASALARTGMHVAIVEQTCWGGGATAAAMGHLVVLDSSAAELALCRYAQLLWQELQPQLPASAHYRAVGTLWIAEDEQEMAEAERKFNRLTSNSVPAEIVSRQRLSQLEPHLRSDLAGGLLVPQDATLFPPVVAAHLLADASQHGAVRILKRKVVRMASGEALLDDGQHLTASRLILATGADAPQLLPALPIRKRKGHLAITDRYPDFIHHQIVELGYVKSASQLSAESVACNVQPSPSGQLLIGSSRQLGVESPAVEAALLGRMLDRSLHFLPGLAQLNVIRTWTGFRASTPDKLPFIGPWPCDPTLWVATGHEGLGITTALATARLLTAALTDQPPAIDPTPYLPERLPPGTFTSNHSHPSLPETI